MKTPFKTARKPRCELSKEIIAHGGTPPTRETQGRLPTYKEFEAEARKCGIRIPRDQGRPETALDRCAAARKRAGLISRAVTKQRQADTLKSRVVATRPAPAQRPAIHPDIQREADLDAAFREYQECTDQRERRQVYAKHEHLLGNAAAIHKASRFAQSTHQKTN